MSPSWYRHECKTCGRPRQDGERFSRRGLCGDCGLGRMLHRFETADEQMSDPEYVRRWRRGMAGSVGAVLPEEAASDD